MNEEQLDATFGTDTDGIQRYRMLEAVLVRGLSQRGAAQVVGVSERTLRNTLRLYRSGDINRLRSRVAARRINPRRAAHYEPALAAALNELPDAGGDRLWRRACELLGDAAGLSRRTAYRVLANLRAEREREREADRGEELGQLRPALALLMEDPPLSLGATPLAMRLLSDEQDLLLRGTLLQQVLHTLIDRLRPAGEISSIDRDWWPYLICSGEYEAGQNRAELEQSLALSASTYSRAKRQALNQIVAALPHAFQALAETPRAASRQRLPRSVDFIGRHDEQAYYAWRLQTEGLAYLWGLPGSGKTALAAELAAGGRRYGQSVIWHACDTSANARLSSIVRGLLRGLCSRDDSAEDLSDMDSDALLGLLRDHLLRRATVIILDDTHRIEPNEFAPLLELLESLVARGTTRLLLVSRIPPPDTTWPMLPGLVEREARLLWADLPLAEAQWQTLFAATCGMPQPLRQLAAACRRAGDHGRSSDVGTAVATWAHEAIWQPLPAQEQALLTVTHGLANHVWADQREHIQLALPCDPSLFESLLRRGLIAVGDHALQAHPLLGAAVEARLAEDSELKALRNAAVRACDTTTVIALDTSAASAILVPAVLASTTAPVSASETLGLLAHLRAVLERSALYLQSGSDQTALRLAAELVSLQAALPDPALLQR